MIIAACPVVPSPLSSDTRVLRLPLPDRAFVSCGHTVARTGAAGVVPCPPETAAALARFRWLVGHQATFCVWRLLAASLTGITAYPDRSVELMSRAAALYDAYSVLLLYSGRCSARVYAEVLRPAMMAADPAFSGRWARDYEEIPALLRSVRSAGSPSARAELARASKTNQLVHVAVARRLVPHGVSLLRESGRSPGQRTTEAERQTYDRFFRVERADCCRHTFAAQLWELLACVRRDLAQEPLSALASHGLTPAHVDAVISQRRVGGGATPWTASRPWS